MLRVLILAVLLTLMAMAFTTLQATAQSPPSKKDATAMMQKAFAAMDLTSPGSPPFYLIAQVHYELGGDGRDGVYELSWAAPDRWREGFEMERVDTEIDVALGDKLYTLRRNPSASLPLLRVRAVLHPDRRGAIIWDQKINRVTSEQLNGEQVTCIDSVRDPIEEHACLDSASNEIKYVRHRGEASWAAFLSSELTELVALADKRYPTHFVSHYFDENMNIKVKTLAVVT